MNDPSDEIFPLKRGWALLWLFVGLAFGGSWLRWHHRMDTFGSLLLGGLAGLFLFAGISQLFRPMVFAALRRDGIEFPAKRIRLIAWSRVLDAQPGPLEADMSARTTMVMTRAALVLWVQPDTALRDNPRAAGFDGIRPLEDNTYECLVDTTQCPVSTDMLLARIRERLGPRAPYPTQRVAAAVAAGGTSLTWRERYGLGLAIALIGSLFVVLPLAHLLDVGRQGGQRSFWEAIDAEPAFLIAVGLGAITFVWGGSILVSRSRDR